LFYSQQVIANTNTATEQQSLVCNNSVWHIWTTPSVGRRGSFWPQHSGGMCRVTFIPWRLEFLLQSFISQRQ